MSDLILPSRRGFLLGLGLVITSPAIVKISSLMPVKSIEEEIAELVDYEAYENWNRYGNSLLTINQITKQAIRMWKNSNKFIQNINAEYNSIFAEQNRILEQDYRFLPTNSRKA